MAPVPVLLGCTCCALGACIAGIAAAAEAVVSAARTTAPAMARRRRQRARGRAAESMLGSFHAHLSLFM
jgi:uncharacterized protein (DUF2062 family)